jgi:hypothetical protein
MIGTIGLMTVPAWWTIVREGATMEKTATIEVKGEHGKPCNIALTLYDHGQQQSKCPITGFDCRGCRRPGCPAKAKE